MPLYNWQRIIEELDAGKIVLRVTDSSSISKLEDDGFFASSCRTDEADDESDDEVNDGYWCGLDSVSDSDLDHIVGHLTGGWQGWGESAPSDFISTSEDLIWIIWELTRRIAIGKATDFQITVIRREMPISYKGPKPVCRDARECLVDWSVRLKYEPPLLWDAKRFASTSSEILFEKRIFKSQIIETTLWSGTQMGSDLPDYLFKPKDEWERGATWMDNLIWNDWKAGFRDANARVFERMMELSTEPVSEVFTRPRALPSASSTERPRKSRPEWRLCAAR